MDNDQVAHYYLGVNPLTAINTFEVDLYFRGNAINVLIKGKEHPMVDSDINGSPHGRRVKADQLGLARPIHFLYNKVLCCNATKADRDYGGPLLLVT